MGRGRAKAKQTKVARELKYWTPDTDLRALERELHGEKSRQHEQSDTSQQYPNSWDEDDEHDSWETGRR